MAIVATGHRRRGSGLASDALSELERAIVLGRHKGKTIYVDSNAASGGNGDSWEGAYTSLVTAIAAAVDDDTILIAPGHAETIATAAGIAIAKNGLNIIGLGRGSRKPTFTWSATDATWTVTGAGNQIANIRCTVSADEVVTLFSVTGAYNTFDAVDYFETATKQAIQFLLTTNAADYITVRNCYHYQVTAPTATSKWIQLVGVDGALVEHNTFLLTLANNAGSVVISGSTAVIRAVIRHNTITMTGGTTIVSAILLVDSSTGSIAHDNRIGGTAAGLAGMVDVGNAGYASENYTQDTPDKSGALDPTADS